MSTTSIALCTYNGARFLAEQLESFLTQTHFPDELIICDDCSTDNTEKIIQRFSRSAPFTVKFEINEKNLGSTKNFEKAISLCNGEIIFLSDQDDIWMPAKVARVVKEFENDINVGLVFSNAELIDENSSSMKKMLWDFSFPSNEREAARRHGLIHVLIKQSTVTGATLAFRSDLRNTIIPIPAGIPGLIHDEWIALVGGIEHRAKYIEQPLIKYRLHSRQQLGVMLPELNEAKKSRAERYETTISFYRKQQQRLNNIQKALSQSFQWKSEETRRETLDLIAQFIQFNSENAEHCEVRRDLSSGRRKRLFEISREYLTGRYGKHSRGILSALRDLLESK